MITVIKSCIKTWQLNQKPVMTLIQNPPANWLSYHFSITIFEYLPSPTNRSPGAVNEHRWISQDLALCHRFLRPGLPHPRPDWQDRNPHRGASVSCHCQRTLPDRMEFYTHFFIELLWRGKRTQNPAGILTNDRFRFAARSSAHICQLEPRATPGPWSSAHHNMVSHSTPCTAKWRVWRVQFWLSSRILSTMWV